MGANDLFSARNKPIPQPGERAMPGVVRILSLDGGGIRGLLSAQVLLNLAKALGREGQEFAESFHMIAGTSTGGIMAAGLCAPGQAKHKPADLVALYRDQGAKIFDRSWFGSIFNPMGVREETYSADALEEILRDRLGDALLADAGPELLVTSYDIERASVRIFKSWRARLAAKDNYRLRDVARATSAAPTYFEPALIYNRDETMPIEARRAALVDGGVFANNPAMCVWSEARRIYPEADSILILSIGTGGRQAPIPYRAAKAWGKVGWATRISDLLMDGVADTVDYQLATLADDKWLHWHRIQVELTGAGMKGAKLPPFKDKDGKPLGFGMDDVDAASLNALIALGDHAWQDFAARNDGRDLAKLVAMLKAPKADTDSLGYEPGAPTPLERFGLEV
jgi:predicted acylesterase/phospholipase RssA